MFISAGTQHVTIWVRVLVLNATFNNISAISCLSVLFVDETGEKTQLPAANH
jgi:hypothetical protein